MEAESKFKEWKLQFREDINLVTSRCPVTAETRVQTYFPYFLAMWPEVNDNTSNTVKSRQSPDLISEELEFRRVFSNSLISSPKTTSHLASIHFQLNKTDRKV